MRIDRCPLEYITPDVVEFKQMMDYADAGTMPVLAGSRDQAQSFMEAMGYWRARLAEGYATKNAEVDDGG